MMFESSQGKSLLEFIVLIASISTLTWLATATSLRLDKSVAWRLAAANVAIASGVFLFALNDNFPSWALRAAAEAVILTGLSLFHDGIARLLKAPGAAKDVLLRFAAPATVTALGLLDVPGMTEDNKRGMLFCAAAVMVSLGCCITFWNGLTTRDTKMTAGNKFTLMAPFTVICVAMSIRAIQLLLSHLDYGIDAERVPLENSFLWACATAIILANVATSSAAIARMILKLKSLSDFDPLTGVMNRRSLERQIGIEFGRRIRKNTALGCVFIDLDDFKKINDRYGHEVGDRALKNAATQMQSVLRATDHLGRSGGEEFMALLPDTDPVGAMIVANRILQALRQHPLALFDESTLTVTASIGVAILDNSAEDSQSLIRRADDAMYTAKKLGKNRVEMSYLDVATQDP